MAAYCPRCNKYLPKQWVKDVLNHGQFVGFLSGALAWLMHRITFRPKLAAPRRGADPDGRPPGITGPVVSRRR